MRILFVAIAALMISGCAKHPSGIGLTELMTATAADVNKFEKWVAAHNADKDTHSGLRFPNRLCLNKIEFELDVSNVATRNAGVGIPIAGSGIPVLGTIEFFRDLTDNKSSNIKLPIKRDYSAIDEFDETLGPANEKTAREAADRFLRALRAGDVQARLEVPPMLPDETRSASFAQDRSLAAELWRIREAIHETVRRSAFDSDAAPLVPGDLEIERKFVLTKKTATKGAGLKILIANPAPTLGFEASLKQTETSVIKIKFAENASKNPWVCNKKSIVEKSG